jgi:hypothetical protein
MIKDPAGPGAAPMAILCKDVALPSNFQAKYKKVYKYEGLHTFMAKSQLVQELPDNSFYQHVNAKVYVGLTNEQCLRLAQRHNNNSHFMHSVTHRDLVSSTH